MKTIFDLIKKTEEHYSTDLKKSKIMNISVDNSLLLHYHFELIHPYYDMNGRMGRLLSIWYAKKFNFLAYLLFFSEAANRFKDEFYYKAFKKSELHDFKFEASYFVASMHMLLIAQKISYLTLKKISNKVKNDHGKKINSFETDIILQLFSKDKDVFYKKEDLVLGVEEINPAQVSQAFSNLEDYGLIKSVNSKPKEYSLIWSKEVLKIIDELLNI